MAFSLQVLKSLDLVRIRKRPQIDVAISDNNSVIILNKYKHAHRRAFFFSFFSPFPSCPAKYLLSEVRPVSLAHAARPAPARAKATVLAERVCTPAPLLSAVLARELLHEVLDELVVTKHVMEALVSLGAGVFGAAVLLPITFRE